MQNREKDSASQTAIPGTFLEYLKSLGPGIVVVLTWLGAGDIVDSSVAGGNYGYALMWVLVLAAIVRFVFVSLIAKYQLCNPNGETVVDGLVRLHPWFAPFLIVASVVMAHVYGAFMLVGCGEACAKLTGRGATWQWSLVWVVAALGLVFRPVYRRIETVFKIILAVLSVALIGSAIWAGPDPAGILQGVFAFSLPEKVGAFGASLVAVSMIGALGGSMMNLAYPYFMELKGWRGPAYRRVQTFDLLLGVLIMILLNLAVWTLGAEVIHGTDRSVSNLDGLVLVLGEVLGPWGERLLLIGVFSAVFTSYVGISMVLSLIADQSVRHWRGDVTTARADATSSTVYRSVALWALISPLVWTLPGMPGFVTLTVIGNGLQVPLVPILAGGLWRITASERFIGREYRNNICENLVMLLTFSLAVWASIELVRSILPGT
ncbi:MAG: Nramp family divalent metal transporter [Planctomycetaceae bacterium]|nr:Nramp family divalent metal transporter [Planctomycetaceae bacterium]